MHEEARSYVARTLTGLQFGSVVEVGGRNINGGVLDLINWTESYTSLDLYPGPGVTIVADVREWSAPEPVDLVVCCEVLEHSEDPEAVVKACLAQLAPDGMVVFTCAGPDRTPHSGLDGGPVRPDEHYANIDPEDLARWLEGLSDVAVEYHANRGDLYAVAVMPGGRG